MNARRASVFALLLGLSLFLTACGDPCCPVIKKTEAEFPWVCQVGCPGGGRWRFDFQVEFQKPNGELCTPAKEFTLTLKNLTLDLEPQEMTWTNPSPGVYKGSVDLGIAADTEYEVTASGGDECQGKGARQFTVNVIDGRNDVHTVCLTGELDPPQCTLQGGFIPVGPPNLLIDTVENQSEVQIRIDKDGASCVLPKPVAGGRPPAVSCLKGQPASGSWDIGIPNRPDCADYADWETARQQLCAKVNLACDCSPAAEIAAFHAACVARINQLRALESLPPLARDTGHEPCSDADAKTNSEQGSHASQCGAAQNDCNAVYSSTDAILNTCIQQQMVEDEKKCYAANPGSCYHSSCECGHYVNMMDKSGAGYIKVACGIYQAPSGGWWAVMNFFK